MAYQENSRAVARFHQQMNNSVASQGKKKDFVYAQGYADSYVGNGGAVAMAQSQRGQAAVWTDGKNHQFHSTGSGMCIAGQGWAVAWVDQDNKAAAYAHQANKNSGGNRYTIANSSNACCKGADGCRCDSSCRCSCGDCVCS